MTQIIFLPHEDLCPEGAVIEAELGVSHDDVHREIGKQQKDSWDDFMKSVETLDDCPEP